jgi:flagellar hook-basal body complex protein FliE
MSVSPADAARAYARVAEATPSAPSDADGFSAALGRAVQGVVDAGHAADRQASAAITGDANLTDVVTAVSRAELAMQTTVAIRDRVVQAYQDIMKMPI